MREGRGRSGLVDCAAGMTTQLGLRAGCPPARSPRAIVECASRTPHYSPASPITSPGYDRSNGREYRTLANILVDSNTQGKNTQEDWHERLIALSLNGPDFALVSLRKLINIRKNEHKLLQDLRRAFLKAVDQTALEICLHAGNPNTVRDLIDGFNDTMEKDLKEMKRALGRSGASMLLSKEFGFSVLAATAAVIVEPISGTIATIGGLTKGLIDYQDRRHKILRDHPSSWLFTATGPSVPIT